MNTFTTRNAAFGILAVISLLSFGGCSQKPSSEEIAAQVKAAIEAEKAKEQAAATTQAALTAQPTTAAEAPVTPPAPVAATPEPVAKHKPVAKKHKQTAKPEQVAGAQSTPQDPAQAEQAAPVQKIVCGNCGVVVSVKEIEQEGKGSGLGAIAGGAAGGLLGHQVGQGSGRDLATIAGVVGGALAGHKIEKTVKKSMVYDVTVQMDSGEIRTLRYGTAPGVVAGDKVKVEGEQVVRQ